MRTRLIGTCVCLIVISTGGTWAADGLEASGSMASAAVATTAVVGATEFAQPTSPYIHPKMPDAVTERLQSAVEIAAERIEKLEECSDLFANLGADGLEMLHTTMYFPARAVNKKDGVCRRSAAYTTVGGKLTFVCPEFSNLSNDRAAMYVVHEALHHAGLTEKPQDRRALTSLQINTMVATKCKF